MLPEVQPGEIPNGWQNLTNGVITLNEDEKIVTCNAAGLRIMRIKDEDVAKKVLNCQAKDFFPWPQFSHCN